MEATGRDGDCEPRIYSYLGDGNSGYTPFSIGSSSSSGTIVSTAYTYSGSGSGLSSVPMHMVVSMPFTHGNYSKLSMIEKRQYIKRLVEEFFDAPSANCSTIEGGRMRVMERWFSDLGVGWALQLDDGVAYAVTHDYVFFARSWVNGLIEIMDSIRLMASSFSEHRRGGEDASIVDALQFAQFIQETMMKMLPFVDVIVAWNAETTTRGSVTNGLPPSYDKLSSLVSVHCILFKALSESEDMPWLYSEQEEVNRIQGEIVSLLSAKEANASKAVSSTLQRISSEVTRYLYVDDPWSSQGSPDIHMATRSVMRYITFLRSNYSSITPFVFQTVLTTLGVGDKRVQPLDSMTVEVTSRLEEKLVEVSESFQDQGLRLLFLLNNLYFIQESLLMFTLLEAAGNMERSHRPLKYTSLDIHVASLFEKVDRHMENYVQESWDPVLSCLFNPSPTPLCLLTRSNSVLSKFGSAFRKTYTTQKLWKVPDPKLRKSLRTTIIEKIIPDYTKYMEENSIATPEYIPKEMEEMLQELFEG